jgi:hypothetical protein
LQDRQGRISADHPGHFRQGGLEFQGIDFQVGGGFGHGVITSLFSAGAGILLGLDSLDSHLKTKAWRSGQALVRLQVLLVG